MSIRGKISYCPICGKKLVDITGTDGILLYSVCKDSSCRTMIKDNHISEMDIDIYCRLQEKNLLNTLDNKNKKYQEYMLLKENTQDALISLLTNNPTESRRVAYNIVRAYSHDEALKYFNDKFRMGKIKPERVVKVQVRVDD